MNVSASLQNVRDAFAVIQSYPSLNKKPIVIGEDDPDGCAACVSDAYGYRNGLVYPSYTAATFSRNIDLAMQYGVNLEGAITWAFEYDDHPYFDGFRVLSTNQVDKPILNIFRMFGKLTGQRVTANSTGQVLLETVLRDSIRGESDVGVLAAYNETEGKLAVMVWNHHDDALPKPDSQVTLNVSGFSIHAGAEWSHSGCESVKLTHYRIDQEHSNSYTKWLAMGSPQDPSTEQYRELKEAGMLQMIEDPTEMHFEDGMAAWEFALPIHAMSLFVLGE